MSNNDTATENDKLQRRIEQLELDQEALSREAEQARWDNQVLRRQLEDTQSENRRLREETARIQEEAANVAKSVNIAWQQGYLAGQQASMADMPAKSFVETLAEAARAATAYSGTENSTQEHAQEVGSGSSAAATATATATSEAAAVAPETISPAAAAPASEPAPEEDIYVAEQVRIEDPNILDDPFTAKLMNALQGEDLDEDEGIDEERPVFTAGTDGVVSIETLREDALPSSDHDYEDHQHLDEHPQNNQEAQPSIVGSHLDFEDQPENPLPNADAGDAKKFSAEELHSLFRNRYVREDDPEAKAAPPAEAQQSAQASTTGGPSKKFVGANKQATEQPAAGGMLRSYPPDVRRCCRLLGINPEELSKRTVLDAWKKEMSKPGVHPDTGGDTEMAIYLNVAKETLMRWVEDQTPKLGKKFGAGGSKTAEANKPPAKQD